MDHPNILLIITDQQRADHLGCYGNELLKTPNIDTLAERGTVFRRFYVSNPICSPNRATLMTGRLPSAHGLRCNGAPLPLEARTFVECLAEKGYRTALFGKSHLQHMTGGPPEWLPSEEDFAVDENGFPVEAVRHDLTDEKYDNEDLHRWLDDINHKVKLPYYGFQQAELTTMHADRTGGDYLRWISERHPDHNSLRGAGNALPDNRISTPQAWRTAIPEELYSTTWVGSRTIDYLQDHALNHANSPFFIKCSFPDPHHPFTPPGKYWDMYDPEDVQLPDWFGAGDSPITRHLKWELEHGKEIRNGQLPYAVTRREAQEAVALTYGMIAMIDDWVGNILEALDRLNLIKNTIIIFTSDHGDYMGDHGLMLKGPIHLHGMLRVPFIWVDPDNSGLSTVEGLGSTVDIAPSILDRVGIKPYYGIQGQSLIPAVEGDNYERDAILVEDDRERVYLGMTEPQRVRTMITGKYRLTKYHPLPINELYDLENDPGETNNLWGNPNEEMVRAQLTDRMLELMIQYMDKVPLMPREA